MQRFLHFLPVNKFWLHAVGCLLFACTGCVALAHQDQTISPQSQQTIYSALQARRYADAVAAVNNSGVTEAELAFTIAEISLQALADPDAPQKLDTSLEQALLLLEKSALAGHKTASASLAALFFTGLQTVSPAPVQLLASHAGLHACWREVNRGEALPKRCIAMRGELSP